MPELIFYCRACAERQFGASYAFGSPPVRHQSSLLPGELDE